MTNNIVSPVGNLGSMNALTICGWLNSANRTFRTTSSGRGNAIVNASLGGSLGGFVLAYKPDSFVFAGTTYADTAGRLQLYVNEWPANDGYPALASSAATIPLNVNVPVENWVFFAVTYDGLSTTDNLKFYFGNANQEATNDVTSTYNKGVIAQTGTLGIGQHNCLNGDPNTPTPGNPTGRSAGDPPDATNNAVWRGLLDEIKIYSKVLTLAEIREAQKSPSLPPVLKCATQTNHLVLSWEGPFQLQSRTNLTTGSWADDTTPPNVSGTIRSLGLLFSGDSRFLRLRQ
jgi:hypothetical protein